MPSDKKLEGILMPMPVAFKNDGAIDPAGTDAIRREPRDGSLQRPVGEARWTSTPTGRHTSPARERPTATSL